MKNRIELKSINELLGMNFFIPSYQRGYRWNESQVTDLMEDIYTFAEKSEKSKDEFYCLQPIVVRECNEDTKQRNHLSSELDDNKWYEVIDGQQRLTTIRILLLYLVDIHLNGESLSSAYGKPEFNLEYETRDNAQIWLNYKVASNKDIDSYFISNAYKNISAWFEKQKEKRDARESILRTLVYDMKNKKNEGIVQVIWYEIKDNFNDNATPIDTFIRINMGKIPLTNSELIKALFLQKRNFGTDSKDAELRQIEIATEWDRMEYALQNNNFWCFINKDKNEMPAKIEFLFNLIYEVAKREDDALEKKMGTDEHAIFRFFYSKFKENEENKEYETIKNEWETIKEYFLALEDWHNDPVFYHYIGFLVYCDEKIVDIYNLYRGKTKEQFRIDLKNKIKTIFKELECIKTEKKPAKEDIDSKQEIIDLANQYIEKNQKNKTQEKKDDFDYEIDLNFKSGNKKLIRQFLLFYNLQFIVNQFEESGEEIVHFPFELFNKEKNWDIEHIDSHTKNNIQSIDDQVEWIRSAVIDMEGSLSEDLKNNIETFLKKHL